MALYGTQTISGLSHITAVLHDNLKDAFKKIYWYTSDAQGILHGWWAKLIWTLKMQDLC